MKTTPMKHQEVGRGLLTSNPEFYGLGCEQGTGKTWMLIDDFERAAAEGFDGALVIAPKGVHINWVARELPKHMSIPYRAEFYKSGGGVRRERRVEALNKPGDFAVLTMNIDAIIHSGGKVAAKFLRAGKRMMVIDESHNIKSPDSARTKMAIKLGRLAAARRIASGTMVSQGPIDLFSQFEFLSPGGKLLGTTSYRVFVAEYAVLHPPTSRLVMEIKAKSRFNTEPQVIVRDARGRPQWKNLAKLNGLLEKHCYRVLKRDCLDLPDKIYKVHPFELAPAQQAVYDQVEEDLRLSLYEGHLDTFTALTKLTKLRQITSGFVMTEGDTHRLAEPNPRLDALMSLVDDVDGQFIVWAVYKEEIAMIEAAFKAAGITARTYNGDTKDGDREEAVDGFQAGEFRAFIANPQAGGTGLTLTNAGTAIYYSNDFSLLTRLQSEDRNHRIGTEASPVYIDLVALGTRDEQIADALQAKKEVAEVVLGDAR